MDKSAGPFSRTTRRAPHCSAILELLKSSSNGPSTSAPTRRAGATSSAYSRKRLTIRRSAAIRGRADRRLRSAGEAAAHPTTRPYSSRMRSFSNDSGRSPVCRSLTSDGSVLPPLIVREVRFVISPITFGRRAILSLWGAQS